MRPSCGAISSIAVRTRGATVKPSCETNRAARSIRSGSSPKDTAGAAGVSSTAVAQRRQTAERIEELARPVRRDAHRHRVRR